MWGNAPTMCVNDYELVNKSIILSGFTLRIVIKLSLDLRLKFFGNAQNWFGLLPVVQWGNILDVAKTLLDYFVWLI